MAQPMPPLQFGANPNFPGLNPQQVVTNNFEAEGQQMLADSDNFRGDLSPQVMRAAGRFAQASDAVETRVGGAAFTQEQTDELYAAREELAGMVRTQADREQLDDPGDRLLLGLAAVREATEMQIEARPEAGRFISWWNRMGQRRGGRLLRAVAVTGLPAFLVGAGVATVLTGGLPWLAAVGIGAVKGGLIGAVGGRARAAIDRYADNTRGVTRERLRGRMGAMATGLAEQVYEAAEQQQQTGVPVNPADADDLVYQGMNTGLVEPAVQQRNANNTGSRRAMLYGAAAGFVFGAVGAAVGDWLNDRFFGADDQDMRTTPGGGEVPAPVQPPTPDDVKAWLSHHQPDSWAENADTAAENHDGGKYLWNDVQDGGPHHLTDGQTLRTIIPGVNELQAHGAHIDGGGDIKLVDGKWVPGNGKWWFDQVSMPKGGMYAIDSSGKVFYFHGTLSNEHQAVLLDLIRQKAEIFNRDEFAQHAAGHRVIGVPQAQTVPQAVNQPYVGQGRAYTPEAPRDPAYWSNTNGQARNVPYVGQGRAYTGSGNGNPGYWDPMTGNYPNLYAGQGLSYTPNGAIDPAYWAQMGQQPNAGLAGSQNPYAAVQPAFGPELTSAQYLENQAALDRIIADYGQFYRTPVSSVPPSQMVENLITVNADVIRNMPVNFQDQLVAGLAEAARVDQEMVRQALEEVTRPAATPLTRS